MDEKDPVNAYTAPFLGVYHFLKKPSLWLGPLVFSIFSWLIMAAVFFGMVIWRWPIEGQLAINYTWGIVDSFAFSLVTILILWAFVLPFFLDFAYEKMIKKFLISQGVEIKGEQLHMKDILYVLYKTMVWRFAWIIACFIAAILIPPLSFILSGIAFAHVALVDAADVTLALKGYTGPERIIAIRERDAGFLLSALVGGLISLILLPTFIGWLIWVPSLYIGQALWCQHWEEPAK